MGTRLLSYYTNNKNKQLKRIINMTIDTSKRGWYYTPQDKNNTNFIKTISNFCSQPFEEMGKLVKLQRWFLLACT